MEARDDNPRYSRVAVALAAGGSGGHAPPSRPCSAFVPMPFAVSRLPAVHDSGAAGLEPAASDSWLAVLSQLNYLPPTAPSLAAAITAPQPEPPPRAVQAWQQCHAADGSAWRCAAAR